MERLGEVIIGAGVHARYLVAPTITRRQYDHRHLAVAAPPLFENRNTVDFRQTDIQNYDVIRLSIAKKIAFLAVRRCVDRETGVGKRRRKLPVQVLVVLDYQCAHGLIPPLLTATAGYRMTSGKCHPL